MMLETYEALLNYYGSTLAIATSKGYPVWGRPEAQVPCVALELFVWEPGRARIGGLLAQGTTGFRGWLFARHEPELCALLDQLIGWHRLQGGAFEVAAQRVATTLLEVKRHDPETTAQQEQHGVAFLVQATW